VQAVVAVAVIIGFGRLVLQPLFRMAAATDSPELFMALTMLVAIGTGVVTAGAGLSMALGAFVAGLLLAETEYRKAIEATIEPFKGLLLGVFFISVGMKLDLAVLARNPFYFVACAAGLIVLKAAITAPLARLFSLSWPAAIETALLIGPGGEFAFIVVGLAMSAGLIAPANGTALLTVVTLTMVAIPGAARLGTHLSGRIAKNAQPEDHAALEPTGDVKTRALVVGCGRVGRLVSDMLATHNVAHVLTDRDPAAVTQVRKLGREAYFGDAKGARFLERCGLNEAEAVILTINARSEVDEIVAVVRAVRPKIVIVARAKDAKHASHLYKLGVTDAVPETIEASLQLSEAALVGLGAPTGLVIASIHEKRDEFRHELQKASGEAARPIRGIRAARDNRKRKGCGRGAASAATPMRQPARPEARSSSVRFGRFRRIASLLGNLGLALQCVLGLILLGLDPLAAVVGHGGHGILLFCRAVSRLDRACLQRRSRELGFLLMRSRAAPRSPDHLSNQPHRVHRGGRGGWQGRWRRRP
jgi:CPA2 family monovalent cation:H+ antiporter-2